MNNLKINNYNFIKAMNDVIYYSNSIRLKDKWKEILNEESLQEISKDKKKLKNIASTFITMIKSKDFESNGFYECNDFIDKILLVTSMNFLVTYLNNEEAYYGSWIYVVPDEAEDEDLEFIAEDNDLYKDTCELFIHCMKGYVKDGFYINGILYKEEK